MQRATSLGILLLLAQSATGCEPTDGPAPDGGEGDAGMVGDDAGAPDGGPRVATDSGPLPEPDGGPTGSDAGDAGETDAASPDAGVPACPDLFGEWIIEGAFGACGDLPTGERQAIRGDTVMCQAEFVSLAPLANGITGTATIQADGSFTGATLSLDGLARTDCRGESDGGFVYRIECGSGDAHCEVVLYEP